MRTGRLLPVALVLLAMPLIAIVVLIAAGMLAGGSTSGTLATGRTVVTYSDSMFLSSAFSGGTATIKTAGQTILVCPNSLSIDGIKVADIDEAVTSVEVRMKRREVTVIADGQPVTLTYKR
jgi:hypothetical protein